MASTTAIRRGKRMVSPGVYTGLLLLLGLACGAGEVRSQDAPKLVLKRESFDKEPGWDSQNNNVKVEKPIPVVQDFGYSKTNHAGGKAAGEIGGRVQRSTTSAFYGKKLEKAKTLDGKLRCSGSFAVTQPGGLATLYFGWFNTKTPSSRPYNWMGFCLSGESKGCEVHVGYRMAGGMSDGPGRVTGNGPNRKKGVRDFNLIPKNTRYTFDFMYDPDGGDNGEITFTLGGEGPFTGGPFKFKLPESHRKSGATFDAFGIINAQAAGGHLTAYFDDLVIDGQAESFDADPEWVGQANRHKHDDYGTHGSHQFGFSDTAIAGGKKGELGGLLYSSPSTPGYYGDKVGRLTLDSKLMASGKVALTMYGSDSGVYVGWFDSKKRGHPPANVLGVMIDGPTSTPPRFQAIVASPDPKAAVVRRKTGTFLPPDGKSHTWKIEYDPSADEGRGRLTVWLDDQKDTFTLPPEVRKAGATFDRFGLFVHEGGGTASRIYLDDMEYTAADEKEKPGPDARILEGHTASVLAVSFSPDGKTLATASRDKTIKLWDAKTGKVIRTLEGHTDIVRSVAFSPDQKTLVSGGVDLTVRRWDVATGKVQQTLKGHTQRVMAVSFSPGGTMLVSASSDKTARLWDAKTGEMKLLLEGDTGGLEHMEFSPDGKSVVGSSHDTNVRVWDVATGKVRLTLEGHTAEVDCCAFSPDGKTVASGSKDKSIKLWDAKTGKLLRTLTGHTGRVESLTFSPDGNMLATGGGGGDSSVRLWNLTKD